MCCFTRLPQELVYRCSAPCQVYHCWLAILFCFCYERDTRTSHTTKTNARSCYQLAILFIATLRLTRRRHLGIHIVIGSLHVSIRASPAVAQHYPCHASFPASLYFERLIGTSSAQSRLAFCVFENGFSLTPFPLGTIARTTQRCGSGFFPESCYVRRTVVISTRHWKSGWLDIQVSSDGSFTLASMKRSISQDATSPGPVSKLARRRTLSREFLARAFLLLVFLLMRPLFLVSSPIEEHRYSCLHTAQWSAVFLWMMNEASDLIINRALRTLSARGPPTSPK